MSDSLADCERAYLFVMSLAEAEQALQPLKGLRKLNKVMIVTERELYPVCRRLDVDQVVLSHRPDRGLNWLIDRNTIS